MKLNGVTINTIDYIQADTPATPTSGQIWWETDTGILWTYGTYASASRWVSAHLYNGVVSGLAGAARSAAGLNTNITGQFGQGYDIYADTLYVRAHVITTNSAASYWKWDLRKVTTSTVPATTAGTSLGTVNSSANSPDVWFELSASVNAVIDMTGASMDFTFIDITKAGATGTPGNVWEALGLSYRLIHP